MKITISNVIHIHEPNEVVKKYCREKLTWKNPDYQKKKMMGFYVYNIPKEIKLYDFYNGDLYVPLGCFDDLWELHPYKEDYKDYSISKPIKIESTIKLRDYQKPCLKAIEENYNGLFIMNAGTGKTITALECVHHLKQKCIWLTHTKDLLNQAKTECEENMTCKTSTITEGKCDCSGDIVFATVQTLVNIIDKGEIKQDEFGMLIADECFPKDTKISTLTGYKKIQDIEIGDFVYSFNHKTEKIELKQVDYLYKKEYNELIEITLSNKDNLTCTCNHPIYTQRGYIKAGDLKEGDILYEMCLLQQGNKERRLSKRKMVVDDFKTKKDRKNVLFTSLWKKMEKSKFNTICSIFGRSKMEKRTQSDVKSGSKNKSIQNIKRKRTQTPSKRWKWNWNDKATRNTISRIKKEKYTTNTRITNKNSSKSWKWLSNLLQSRFGNRRIKNSDRTRWSISPFIEKTRTRCQKRYVLRELRVESVKIQKSRSNQQFGRSDEKYYVYNIGVKDNNNYFANNILVHNCHHCSVSAETVMQFQQCVNFFACRYKIGLTATLHTANGLHVTIPKILGKVLYEMKKEDNLFNGYYLGDKVVSVPANQFQIPAQIHLIKTNYSVQGKDVFDLRTGTVNFSKLITSISEDRERNGMILKLLANLKGSTIVVGDRVDQLKLLASKWGDNAIFVDGKTKKSVREEGLEKVRNGEIELLFASYKLIAEGFNAPILENLVMVTPVKDLRIVIQSIGRVQRPYKNKQLAHVYDLVDDVGKLDKFLRERKKIYKKEGYEVDDGRS